MNLLIRYKQFIKFGFVALTYNLFAYGIYSALIAINCNYLLASTISFIAGITLSYFMNKKLVFSVDHHNYILIYRYLFFYLLLLIFNLSLLNIFVKQLMFNPYFAQFLVTIFAALLSYNLMRIFVFRKK